VIIELPPTNGFLPEEITVPNDALLVYLCPLCDLIYNRPLKGISDTFDPVALRAHAGILRDHSRFYGHRIYVFDTLLGDYIDTIPKTPRLQ
jgi:hypothetical protein